MSCSDKMLSALECKGIQLGYNLWIAEPAAFYKTSEYLHTSADA
jgi:hypothetical protein